LFLLLLLLVVAIGFGVFLLEGLGDGAMVDVVVSLTVETLGGGGDREDVSGAARIKHTTTHNNNPRMRERQVMCFILTSDLNSPHRTMWKDCACDLARYLFHTRQPAAETCSLQNFIYRPMGLFSQFHLVQ
jgi:hypothetical protein